MVRAVVKNRKTVKVKVQVSNTGQILSSSPVTIQTLPVPPTRRLDSLADVDATGESQGGVPVYQEDTDTYVVQQLNLSADINEIDGGSFAHKVYINTPGGKQPHYYKKGVLTWKNTDLFMYGETGNWIDST